MSMPHNCTCRTCGLQMLPAPDAFEMANERTRGWQAGVKQLSNAIVKVAPEAAKDIAQRWDEMQAGERTALEEFLKFLREQQSNG